MALIYIVTFAYPDLPRKAMLHVRTVLHAIGLYDLDENGNGDANGNIAQPPHPVVVFFHYVILAEFIVFIVHRVLDVRYV